MRLTTYQTLSLSVLLGALFVSFLLGEQEESPAISIKLLTPKILIAEPVLMKLIFYNPTDKPVKMEAPVFSMHGNAFLHFEDGESITPLPLRGAYALSLISLGAKQIHEEIMDLSIFSLPEKPGEYTVYIVYFSGIKEETVKPPRHKIWKEIWKGKIVSNKEKLIIHAPIGVDAEVFKILKTSRRHLRSWGEPEAFYGSNIAEEILKKYPKSRYTKYCLFYLGKRYLFRNWEKGIVYLQQVIAENPDHLISHWAQLVIVDELLKKGRIKEAGSALKFFYEKFPNSELNPWAKKIQARLEELGEKF